MVEIIQSENLIREKVFELFKNKTFMEYSPLFYESQKTISEVLRLLGKKGRNTINNQLRFFRQNSGYDPRYIQTEISWKPPQKKIIFTHRIVMELLFFHARETGQKLDLTEQEVELLLKFMNLPGVNLVLRRKNKNWLDILTKLSVSMVFFIVYQEKVGEKRIFIRDLERFVETLTVFKEFTRDEREAYLRDIQEFNREVGGQIYRTAAKIVNLNMPISLGSTDIYFLTRGATEAATYGGKAIFEMCKRISPDLERRLKMKANRPEIVATLAEFGIDLLELLSKKRQEKTVEIKEKRGKIS